MALYGVATQAILLRWSISCAGLYALTACDRRDGRRQPALAAPAQLMHRRPVVSGLADRMGGGCRQDGPADEGDYGDRLDGQRLGDVGRRDRLPEAEQAHGQADQQGADGGGGVAGGEQPGQRSRPYEQDGGQQEGG